MMLRYLFALILLLITSAASATTVVSDGSDGLFNPAGITQLTVPSDGIFNFTSIDFGADVDLTFNRGGFNDTIWLAALGDISISGSINWDGGLGLITNSGNILFDSHSNLNGQSLYIESPNAVTLDGVIKINNEFDIRGNTISLNGVIDGSNGSTINIVSGDPGSVHLNDDGGSTNGVTLTSGGVAGGTISVGPIPIIESPTLTLLLPPPIGTLIIPDNSSTLICSCSTELFIPFEPIVLIQPVPVPAPAILMISALGILFPRLKKAHT